MKFRKIRSVTAVFCVLVCMLCSTIVCGAVQERYTINEINDMIITLPDGMLAITRSSENTDKYFSVFGLDYNATMQNFENGDIYLQGMDSNSSVTVTVTMTKTDESKAIGNYNLLEPDKLSEVSSNFLSQSEYSSCTPDISEKIVWLNFDANVTSRGVSIKAYQANTVYSGMSVSVTYQRNAGNVTQADYASFTEIINSIDFLKESSIDGVVPYIIIGASICFIILVIVLVIVTKQLKKRRKRSKNDKILKELAGKYSKKRNNNPTSQNTENSVNEDNNFENDGDDEEYTFDKTEIDSEDFFRGVEKHNDDDVKIYNSSEDKLIDSEIDEILNSKTADKAIGETAENNTDDEVVGKADLSETEEVEDISSADSAEEETEETEETEKQTEKKTNIVVELEDSLFGEADENDEEDYNNDEELIRQEAKRVKFKDSYDFFEEAPKKTMGVISSKDLLDAEDFDVINEVEERVKEVEKPAQKSGNSFVDTMKKVGGGIKSFGVHLGYFCTNVSRMIKRKRAIKKRQKAEAERRERARRRAERQRAQRQEMENGGLVQVHRRSDRRPSNPHNRRSAQQRNVQQRRQGSTQRRPSNPQNRNNRRR